jgi:hypothetical protein
MFEGRFCSYMSDKTDQFISRQVGMRSPKEFIADYRADAASPAQLDALAFQFLCVARRIKAIGKGTISGTVQSKIWKDGWEATVKDAAEARARLEAQPNRETHPGFFNHRSVGKPGHLDSDLYFPHVARFDLGVEKISAGIYEPDIINGAVYTIGGSRDGKTWITPVDGNGREFPVQNKVLRGLQNLGRIVALPLSAAKKAA